MSGLQRNLGLFHVFFLGLGLMVGAGVHSVIGNAVKEAGELAWLSFLFAGFIAALTGLSYCELSSMFPKAGASYIYAKNAFSRYGGMIGFVVAVTLIIENTIGVSMAALIFGKYLNILAGVHEMLASIGLIILIALVSYAGARFTANLNIVLMLTNLVGILTIIVMGIVLPARIMYITDFSNMGGMINGMMAVFFSFLGFEILATSAEETKNPERTIPKAILLCVGACTALYVISSLGFLRIFSAEQFSATPFIDAMNLYAPSLSWVMVAIIMLSAANTAILLTYASTRILYGMASEKAIPEGISGTNGFGAPHFAIGIVTALAMLLCIPGNMNLLFGFAYFGALFAFAMDNLSLIMLRIGKPELERPFKVPMNVMNIPITAMGGLLFSLILLLYIDKAIIATGAALMLAAAFVYKLKGKEEGHYFRYSIQ